MEDFPMEIILKRLKDKFFFHNNIITHFLDLKMS